MKSPSIQALILQRARQAVHQLKAVMESLRVAPALSGHVCVAAEAARAKKKAELARFTRTLISFIRVVGRVKLTHGRSVGKQISAVIDKCSAARCGAVPNRRRTDRSPYSTAGASCRCTAIIVQEGFAQAIGQVLLYAAISQL